MALPFSRNWTIGVIAGALVGLVVTPFFNPFRDSFNFLAWPGCASFNELDSLSYDMSNEEAETQFLEASERLKRIIHDFDGMKEEEEKIMDILREIAATESPYIENAEKDYFLERLDFARKEFRKAKKIREENEDNLESRIASARERLVEYNDLPDACFNGGGFDRFEGLNLQ